MRNGAQQVHVHFWDDVSTHRDVIRLGERRHTAPGRDAANAPQVDNGDSSGAHLQQPVEFGQLIQMLSRGHWNEQITGNGRQPGDVLMLDGVLEPGDAGLLQDTTSLPGLRQVPAFGGVNQDTDIRTYRLSDCLDAAGLGLWAGLMAEAHFDGRIPAYHM